jgi:hypothetical protein
VIRVAGLQTLAEQMEAAATRRALLLRLLEQHSGSTTPDLAARAGIPARIALRDLHFLRVTHRVRMDRAGRYRLWSLLR